MLKVIPRDYFDGGRGTLKLLWEDEWRGLGITQSLGWEHYEVHEPEPHILLFKYGISPSSVRSYKLTSLDGRRTTFRHSSESILHGAQSFLACDSSTLSLELAGRLRNHLQAD